MHVYLIKSRVTNNIVRVFEALDDSDALDIMRQYYHYLSSNYYLERIYSYSTVEVSLDKKV